MFRLQPDFDQLNDTCLIMIMPFDLFGRGRYRYTCKSYCVEEPDIIVEDGAIRIFLNTRGTNSEGVNQELIDFLHYVEESTNEQCSCTKSVRIQRIHENVKAIKTREDVGVRYMQEWEREYYIREDGRAEGREEGRVLLAQLYKCLQKDDCLAEYTKALEDPNCFEELLKRYHLPL